MIDDNHVCIYSIISNIVIHSTITFLRMKTFQGEWFNAFFKIIQQGKKITIGIMWVQRFQCYFLWVSDQEVLGQLELRMRCLDQGHIWR